MADTQRTIATLQVLLADNATGDISPQDLRDFLVTALGVYGGMSCFEASTAQGSLGTTPVLLTCWDTDDPSSGVTPDSTTDSDLTIAIAGDYFVWFQASFTGSANAEVHYHLRKNTVEQTIGSGHKLGGGGDIQSMAWTGIITLAASDTLEVYVETDGGGSDSITISDAQFGCRLLG